MTLYLATHNRQHPHGIAINRASIVTLGSDGAHGHERHATHAYVVARLAGYCVRLDGDIPRATFRPWGGAYGVPQFGAMAPLLWRVPDDKQAMERMWALAYELPPYDPAEIGQAALTALKALVENIPLPFSARAHLPGGRDRLTAHDAVKRAMICSRLAAKVTGLSPPDLYPETLARMAKRLGWDGPHLPEAVEAGRA